MKKDIAITGGLGFIGHRLARHYLDLGYKVRIIDNLTNHQSHTALTKYRLESLRSENVIFYQNDCCDLSVILSRFKESSIPRSIIHLASFPNNLAVKNDPLSAIDSMTKGTWAVSQLCSEFQIKLVHISSSMVYGNFINVPQKESAALNPINLYGILKKTSEDIVKLNVGNSIILRPSAVYGPGDNFDRVIAKWIKSAIKHKDITVHDPAMLLDFTYVDDLVKGIATAEEKAIAGNTYNLTRGQARSLGEVAHIVKLLCDSKSLIDYSRNTDKDVPLRGALDINLAKNHFGYKPQFDITEGIQQYVNWVKRNLELLEDDN